MKKSDSEKPNVSLVDLNAQYKALAAEIIEFGGELTPETESRYDALLEALCAKTDGYGIVMDQLEAMAAFWKYQKDKCANAQRVAENNIAALKERMKLVLSETEGHALQGELYRFFLAKAAPVLVIDDLLLPAKYKKSELVVTADRTAIQAAVNAGETVPGVTVKENKSLRTGRPK